MFDILISIAIVVIVAAIFGGLIDSIQGGIPKDREQELWAELRKLNRKTFTAKRAKRRDEIIAELKQILEARADEIRRKPNGQWIGTSHTARMAQGDRP